MPTIITSMSGDFPEDYNPANDLIKSIGGPQIVDKTIRQAIAFCFMILPQEKKTYDNIESEIRRIVDRALDDLKEDFQAFGNTKN